MLQHAFSAALFPEHEVQIAETIPGEEAMNDSDVVIIDAAALMQHNSLQDRDLAAIQKWKIPTIWIDAEGLSQAPQREKLVPLRQGLSKAALQKALAECAGFSAAAANPAEASPAARGKSKDQSNQQQEPDKRVIELVDVVEEGSAQGKTQRRRK